MVCTTAAAATIRSRVDVLVGSSDTSWAKSCFPSSANMKVKRKVTPEMDKT